MTGSTSMSQIVGPHNVSWVVETVYPSQPSNWDGPFAMYNRPELPGFGACRRDPDPCYNFLSWGSTMQQYVCCMKCNSGSQIPGSPCDQFCHCCDILYPTLAGCADPSAANYSGWSVDCNGLPQFNFGVYGNTTCCTHFGCLNNTFPPGSPPFNYDPSSAGCDDGTGTADPLNTSCCEYGWSCKKNPPNTMPPKQCVQHTTNTSMSNINWGTGCGQLCYFQTQADCLASGCGSISQAKMAQPDDELKSIEPIEPIKFIEPEEPEEPEEFEDPDDLPPIDKGLRERMQKLSNISKK